MIVDDRRDLDFAVSILPAVSRTFAISIEGLPDELRDAVRTAYLLCRIVDTIEDESPIPASDRESLFDAFDAALGDDQVDPAAFERRCARLDLARGSADGDLCRGAGAIFRSFRTLPDPQRDVIRARVSEMSKGMRETCARMDYDGALQIADVEDLELYCYFVAGTVGEMLTGLFELGVPDLSGPARAGLRERAESFGIGLQLVNILKDAAGDSQRGVCYLPESLAAEHGLRLDRILDPASRDAALALIRHVSTDACSHLERAREYVALWPTHEAGMAVRRFCAVPLALAFATLAVIMDGSDTLRPGVTPKVSREVVARILHETSTSADSDESLAALFDRCLALRVEAVGNPA